MRHVRANSDRDENHPPSIDDCLAHRCAAHREFPPVDDTEESNGAECGICVGHKFVSLLEEKTEEHILDTLFWPMIETARARLNLLARGAGESLVAEAREYVDKYIRARTESTGAHAKANTATPDDRAAGDTGAPAGAEANGAHQGAGD